MGQGDVAVLFHPAFELPQHLPRVITGRHLELGDLLLQSPDRGPGRQRVRGEPHGVDQSAQERFWRFRLQLVNHPTADRGGELFQRIAQDPRAQTGALGQVQEHVPLKIADLQPRLLVLRLRSRHHLRHLHRVVDGKTGDRSSQRAERPGHHLADVAAGVHMVCTREW